MFSTKILTAFLITVFISKSLQLTVDCEYKISKRWKVVGDAYSCFLTSLDVKSKLFVTNATGIHLDGYTNSDVKVLKIIGGCEIIPSGFASIFPNIEVVSVWKANLQYVSSADLQEFSHLREIWLYVNSLDYLESKLFQYNPNVEVINFNGNDIKYIGEHFFNYLPKLQRASFIYNKCINDEAKDADKLSAIKSEIKENCAVNETTTSLQIDINCDYGSLSNWREGKDRNISPNWRVVQDPYGCLLTALDIRTKLFVMNATGTHRNGNTNSDVKALSIYGGICQILPSAFGSVFTNIEALSVSNASLVLISSRDLQQFINLREIWVFSNDIDYLESNLFQYNPKVEIVVFKSNKIKYIGDDFFNYLPNLQTIDLWDNDCVNNTVVNAAALSVIKDEIKEYCAVLSKEPIGYTTISPEGFTYWINITYEDDGTPGLGGFNSDGMLDSRVLSSLIG